MALADDLARLRPLVGKHLPVDGAEPVEYTDAELEALLQSVPACPLSAPHYGSSDVYGVAALVWEDKALAREVELTMADAGQGPLVKRVGQGDASVELARPTPLTQVGGTLADDPAAMRVLAARLRRRSCARTISHDVLPPNVVRPGRAGVREYDGGDSLYTDPRSLTLHDTTNPDHVINLPEVE